MFFAITHGPLTKSALPYLNMLEILSVDNLYRLSALKFTPLWHKGQLPRIFDSLFQYTSDVHTYNTRYSSKQKGKQITSFAFIDLWKAFLNNLKTWMFFVFQNW
jgi:hypothetical protein